MKTLRQVIQEAEKRKVAIGHFNISDLAALKAIFESAHLTIRLRFSINQHQKRERKNERKKDH